MNVAAALGGLGDVTAVIAHGVVGHRWLTMQLRGATLVPSVWGDADMARRVLFISWHFVTVLFAASAIALFARAVGAFGDAALCRFLAGTHVALMAVGLGFVNRRIAMMVRPFAVLALGGMTTAAAGAWLAA